MALRRALLPAACVFILWRLGASAQTADPKPAEWQLDLGLRPTLRYGNMFRISFRGKVQTDFLAVTNDRDSSRSVFALGDSRIGFAGAFLKDFDYQVEYEPGSDGSRWRTVDVGFRRWRWMEIQAGKFKMPLSRDQMVSPFLLDYVYRSRLAGELAPGWGVGVMAQGTVVSDLFMYQFGVFRDDGANALVHDVSTVDGPGLAGRLLFSLAPLIKKNPLRGLEFAAAFTTADVRAGANSLRGRTAFGETFFPRVDVRGNRTRLGGEAAWFAGPFSIQSEVIQTREQRVAVRHFVSRGWYTSGTWLLTGEKKVEDVHPRKEFLREGGFGAVEVAVRTEFSNYGIHPRAGDPPPGSDRAWTFGVNWYLNRYMKFQVNAVREDVTGLDRLFPGCHQNFWTRVVRLQFVN